MQRVLQPEPFADTFLSLTLRFCGTVSTNRSSVASSAEVTILTFLHIRWQVLANAISFGIDYAGLL